MKKVAVIVAAGTGSRMGNSVPKQFLELSGRPLLLYSVEAFVQAYADISIVLVVHVGYLDHTRRLIDRYQPDTNIFVIVGGASRSDSVRAGLALVPADSIVLVHDAARCLVSPELIRRCHDAALQNGSAIPVVPVVDSVRLLTAGGSEPISREQLRLVQTPQAFQSNPLKEAYDRVPGKDFSDDAAVLEHAGIAVHLVEGDPVNIKITRPVDLQVARQLKKDITA